MKLSTELEEIRGSVTACLRCNSCQYGAWPDIKATCPLYAHEASFTNSAGGLLYLARAILQGRMDFNAEVADLAYTCAACGACDSRCMVVRSINPLMALSDMIRLIRYEHVKRGMAPDGKVAEMYAEVERHGDFVGDAKPYPVPDDAVDENADVLLIAHDLRWDGQAKPLGDALGLLAKAGMKVALHADPGNCGSTLYDFGFWDQLPGLVEKKWQAVKERGDKSLLFLDPHCQEFMTEKYRKVIDGVGRLQGRHISEALLAAFETGALKSKAGGKVRVAYHDPCHLGRGLGIYEPPRQLLAQIDGVEIVEMDRNREQALCCGAGALGNHVKDPAMATARDRLGDFRATGADLLITACPNCKQQLGKAMGDQAHRVKDLVEFIAERVE